MKKKKVKGELGHMLQVFLENPQSMGFNEGDLEFLPQNGFGKNNQLGNLFKLGSMS